MPQALSVDTRLPGAATLPPQPFPAEEAIWGQVGPPTRHGITGDTPGCCLKWSSHQRDVQTLTGRELTTARLQSQQRAAV